MIYRATVGGRRARHVVTGCACLSALAVTGCPPAKRPPMPVPTMPAEPASLTVIKERYNANADRMSPTVLLLAKCSVEAGYVDDDGELQRIEGEGNLNFVKPNYFYLELRHGLGGTEVAQIGSDGKRYWMWYEKKLWWGKHEHLDKPAVRDMPIRPEQLITSLGLTRLPDETIGLVGPCLRVDTQSRRHTIHPPYRLGYYWRDGMRLEREYGISQVPPYLADWIIFGDEFGRIGYEATLAQLKPVRVEKEAIKGDPPLMPHYVTLHMSGKNNYLSMRIKRPRLKPFTSRLRPPDKWRKFPERPGCEVIQIDAAYDRPTTRRRK